MKCIRFNFNRGWQTDILGDEEPYLFYLTEGTHQIRLSVTLEILHLLLK